MRSAVSGSTLPSYGQSPAVPKTGWRSPRGRHVRPVNRTRMAAVGVSAALLPVPALMASPAAAASKVPTRVTSSAPAVVAYGGTAVISGRLRTTAGSPLAGARLEFQQPSGRGWRTFAAARTTATGRAAKAIRLTASKRVRVYYRGSARAHFDVSGSRLITVRRTKSTASTGSAFGQRVIAEARRHRGKPYRWGATGPNSFDCSGFTKYVFARNGVRLPRVSRDQQRAVRRVPNSSKRVGDLIFGYTGGRVTHVAIYAGGGRIWHSPRSGDVVKLSGMYAKTYTTGRVR